MEKYIFKNTIFWYLFCIKFAPLLILKNSKKNCVLIWEIFISLAFYGEFAIVTWFKKLNSEPSDIFNWQGNVKKHAFTDHFFSIFKFEWKIINRFPIYTIAPLTDFISLNEEILEKPFIPFWYSSVKKMNELRYEWLFLLIDAKNQENTSRLPTSEDITGHVR